MECLEVVNSALADFYKSKIIISGIEENLTKITKKVFINKYGKKILKIGENEYKLHNSRVLCWFVDANLFDNKKITAQPYFIRINNLKATDRYKIKEEIDRYEKHEHMWETNHKIPIILRYSYEISLEEILNNSFTLDIENQMI